MVKKQKFVRKILDENRFTEKLFRLGVRKPKMLVAANVFGKIFFLTLNSCQFYKEVGGYNPNSGIFLCVA